jgi:hypothetical protein
MLKDYRVDLAGLGWSPLTSPTKHDIEPSDFTKCLGLFDYVRNY